MEHLHPADGVACILSSEAHYSRLFNEAMERATKTSVPSIVAAYLKQAKHWLGAVGAGSAEAKRRRGVEKQMNGGK
jgi:hypothetical protein